MREDFDTQVMNVLRRMGLSGAANFIGQTGATMPGTVLGGEGGFKTREEPLPFDRTPEQRQKASFDVGIGLGPGILGDLGRARIGAGGAKKAVEDRNKAIEMRTKGATPQQIWDETAAALGADRRWRGELPGQAADPEVLDAMRMLANRQDRALPFQYGDAASREFATAYPELMSKLLTIHPQNYGRAGAGSFNPETFTMELMPGATRSMLPSLFEHEAMHGVQKGSGFNRGASLDPGMVNVAPYLALPELQRLAGFLSRELNIPNERGWQFVRDPVVRAHLQSAGESEARNAARRLDLRLRQVAPEWTEDIPRNKQIVQMPSGKEMRPNQWQSPLYESKRDLLLSNKNPNLGTDESTYVNSPNVPATIPPAHRQEWRPGPTFVRYLEEYKAQYGEKEYLDLLQRMMRGARGNR